MLLFVELGFHMEFAFVVGLCKIASIISLVMLISKVECVWPTHVVDGIGTCHGSCEIVHCLDFTLWFLFSAMWKEKESWVQTLDGFRCCRWIR